MKALKSRLPWIVLGIVVIYSVVCLDVVLRARHAYLEGERAPTPQLAYAWYESAATLFVPPESKWSRMARAKMPEAKARWIAEVRAKKIPLPDRFFE